MKIFTNKRLLIIIGGILLIFLAGGTVAWKYQLLPVGGMDKEQVPTPEPPPFGVNFALKELTINLADSNPSRYMKIEVVLEVAGGKGPKPAESAYKKLQEKVTAELSPAMPALEDTVISALTVKKSAELLTEAGKDRVKQELMQRMQHLIEEHKILNVYFRQFIIQ
ncbi:MAG: flagellar basal body-associated FliL family protein [Chloroflexota bacterium]|nr:MAG: flagellar basal body-associated FliL family protein [Chloroflexota bacterium]